MSKKNREGVRDQKQERRCAECRRVISMGEDAFTLERVVIGPRGPVPVGDLQVFHINGCLEAYFCNSTGQLVPKRIP